MNAKSDGKYRGIIITRDAKKDFAKIKAIIDEQVRDDQIRLVTRGETQPQKEARAIVATSQSNRGSKTKELGPIVPAKLYVTNLNYKMTTEDRKAAFSKHGTVHEVDIVSVRGRPIGFGFVTYKNAADADNARKSFHVKELSERQIGVVQYRSRQKDGAAGMAKGTDEGFETGSAMSVEVDDEVDEEFNVPENEYMDWNYGMAFFSSESLSTSSPKEITGLIDSGCSDHLSPAHLPDHRDQSTLWFGIGYWIIRTILFGYCIRTGYF
jgi:RNA recognition motif-containing protein